MKLTDAEKAMFDGQQGLAKQKAMDLLVRYGEALGAERLVDVKNVAGTWNAGSPAMKPFAEKGMDTVFSKFNLDSDVVVETPQAEVYTCQLIHGIDTQNAHVTGVPQEAVERQKQAESYFGKRGVAMFNTCTPYQVGNVPVRGEHCAWMESSAVVYCNGVLGARTNTEGRESTGAASITGKIPYWGFHLEENRLGTHLVEVEVDVDDMMEWGLLGLFRRRGRRGGHSGPTGDQTDAEHDQAQALRRGSSILGRGRDVPYPRHHAGGADAAGRIRLEEAGRHDQVRQGRAQARLR